MSYARLHLLLNINRPWNRAADAGPTLSPPPTADVNERSNQTIAKLTESQRMNRKSDLHSISLQRCRDSALRDGRARWVNVTRPGGRCQDEVSHRGTASHSHAYVHHTTAPQRSRHKSGHSPIKRTISYSEKPVTTDLQWTSSTEPFVIVEHLFRNDFDDTEPVFVLISASMFYYNVPITNICSHRCRFKKWAQHWAQKEAFPW